MPREAILLAIRGVAALSGALLLAATAACGGQVPLDSHPADADAAGDLAGSVAAAAGCDDLEAETAGDGHWDFTCRRGDDSFLVQAVATAATRQTLTAALTAAGTPVKGGPYYLVSPMPACPEKDLRTCVTPPASSLEAFPGS